MVPARVAVNADHHVGLVFSRQLDPPLQRNEVIPRAGEDGAHAGNLLQLRLELFRDRKDDVGLRESPIPQSPRVVPAVAGIDRHDESLRALDLADLLLEHRIGQRIGRSGHVHHDPVGHAVRRRENERERSRRLLEPDPDDHPRLVRGGEDLRDEAVAHELRGHGQGFLHPREHDLVGRGTGQPELGLDRRRTREVEHEPRVVRRGPEPDPDQLRRGPRRARRRSGRRVRTQERSRNDRQNEEARPQPPRGSWLGP